MDAVLKQRPVDRGAVEGIKARMLREAAAQELKSVREAAKLTVQQVADAAGLDPGTLAEIEHGETGHVELDLLQRYVRALGGELRVEIAVAGEVRRLL